MTAEELREASERLGFSNQDLSEMYNASLRDVDAWLGGSKPVPKRVARDIGEARRSVGIGDEVERRLAASGLPECDWLKQFSDTNPMSLSDFRAHAQSCASCAERDRLATELTPGPPQGLWARLKQAIGL